MERVQDVFHHIQNIVSEYKSENKYSYEESLVIDSVEVLSFSVLLHLYMSYYLFIIHQPLIAMLVYQAFTVGVCYTMFQYNFFSFIFHPYFKKHAKDIVFPQTVYTLFHYYLVSTNYPFYMMILLNIMVYSLCNRYFENVEHIESRKIRTFMNLFIYFIKFLYIKFLFYF